MKNDNSDLKKKQYFFIDLAMCMRREISVELKSVCFFLIRFLRTRLESCQQNNILRFNMLNDNQSFALVAAQS